VTAILGIASSILVIVLITSGIVIWYMNRQFRVEKARLRAVCDSVEKGRDIELLEGLRNRVDELVERQQRDDGWKAGSRLETETVPTHLTGSSRYK
jgi:preprotein translocase subunit YajC